MRNKIAIALLIAGLLSIGAWNGQGQTDKPRNVSYEYQVIFDPTATQAMEEGVKQLNQIGAEGWEITGVIQYGNNAPMLYLKRRRRSL